MLNIIHQNGTQKFETGNYFIDKTRPPEGIKEGTEFKTGYILVAIIEGAGAVTLAEYDNYNDICAIFAHLVKLEKNCGLAVLPIDEKTKIEQFLANDYGWDMFR